MVEAGVVASMWKNRLLGAFLALLVALPASWFVHKQALNAGIEEGLTTYHRWCYTIGGFVLIDDAAVMCTRAGKKDEQPLDKGKTT